MKRPLSARGCPWTAGLALAAALALGGCVHPAAPSQANNPPPPPACDAALCNISDSTWDHINERHCQGSCVNDNKSIFVAAYCGSRANAVAFCQALMARPGCAGVAQPPSRVAYGADLAGTVGANRAAGCANTVHGTVIYDTSTSAVVTQFPGYP